MSPYLVCLCALTKLTRTHFGMGVGAPCSWTGAWWVQAATSVCVKQQLGVCWWCVKDVFGDPDLFNTAGLCHLLNPLEAVRRQLVPGREAQPRVRQVEPAVPISSDMVA